jgi:hypothetical protein
MTITTLDGLVAASRTKLPFYKISATSLANSYQSLWKTTSLPLAGITPPTGSGEVPNKTTLGGFNFSEVGGSALVYGGRAILTMATLGTLLLYDRLVHTSGLSGNITSEQTVNSTALTRHTDGAGVELFLEWYTATGASASTVTIVYTNSSGTTGRIATAAIQTSPAIGTMQKISLQDSDLGIRSVQSVTLSAGTGVAGNFGITLMYRISDLAPEAINNGKVFGPFDLGLPTIAASPCIALAVLTTTTTTGILQGSIDLLQG